MCATCKVYRVLNKCDLTFLSGIVCSERNNGVVHVSCLCNCDQSYEGRKEGNANILSSRATENHREVYHTIARYKETRDVSDCAQIWLGGSICTKAVVEAVCLRIN